MLNALHPTEEDRATAARSMEIEAREWRWVAGCAAVVLALVGIAYGVALLHPPQGYLLARTLYYGFDLPNYLAALGDGMASASWLVQNHFTSEPHSPAFMFPLYVLMGKIAALLGAGPVAVLAVFMALSGLALILAGYAFSAAFTASVRERRAALLLLLFASGLGIWIAAAAPPAGAGQSPHGFAFDRAEVSTYLLLFGPPHLTLALALLLCWGRALAAWTRLGTRRSLLWLALSSGGVGLLNAFSLLSLLAVATAYALARGIATARFPLREAGASLLVAAVLAPLLANSLLTFALNPFWTTVYNRQNPVGSPPPWLLGLDFAWLLPLALLGAARGRAERESRLLLAAWGLTLLALIYLPVPFQRRFGYGLQPVLAVLAALGASRLEALLRSTATLRRWRRLSLAAGSVLLFGGTALGFALLIMAALGSGALARTVFEPRPVVAAADWLARNSGPSDVVLSSMDTSNLIAGKIRGRVVWGHPGLTLDPKRKEALARDFYSPAAPPEERWRLVAEERISYVVLSSREEALGGGPVALGEGFRLVYEEGGVRIYRVERSLSRLDPAGSDRRNTLSTSPRNASLHSGRAASNVARGPSFSTSTTSTR